MNNVSSCKDVLIKLEANESNLSGIIHSPNYKQTEAANESVKCKWTLSVPQDFEIKINIVDIVDASVSKCNSDKLSFTSDQDTIKVIFFNANKNVEKTILLNKTIDNCNHANLLKSFAKLKTTHARQLTIDYESGQSNLIFLLAFQLVSSAKASSETGLATHCNDLEELKCVNTLQLSNLNTLFKQYSCIRKDLICNCLTLYPLRSHNSSSSSFNSVDKCEYLLSTPNNYFLSLQQTTDQMCSFYSDLNTKCKRARLDALSSKDSESNLEEDQLGDEYIDYSTSLKGRLKSVVEFLFGRPLAKVGHRF